MAERRGRGTGASYPNPDLAWVDGGSKGPFEGCAHTQSKRDRKSLWAKQRAAERNPAQAHLLSVGSEMQVGYRLRVNPTLSAVSVLKQAPSDLLSRLVEPATMARGTRRAILPHA